MKKRNISTIVICLISVIFIILIIAVPIRLLAFDSEKTLIVYFSRVGNTQFSEDVDAVSSASLRNRNGILAGNCEVLAEKISKITEADIFEINVSEQYPEDYDETVNRASSEQSENARPELVSHVENMENYDNVILIYPVWWSTIPMPVFSFLEEYDFSEKNIYPVATHKGSFLGQSVSDIKVLCPESDVHMGIPISGGSVDFIGIIPFVMIFSWILIAVCVILEKCFKPKSVGTRVTTVLLIIGIILNILCIIRMLI